MGRILRSGTAQKIRHRIHRAWCRSCARGKLSALRRLFGLLVFAVAALGLLTFLCTALCRSFVRSGAARRTGAGLRDFAVFSGAAFQEFAWREWFPLDYEAARVGAAEGKLAQADGAAAGAGEGTVEMWNQIEAGSGNQTGSMGQGTQGGGTGHGNGTQDGTAGQSTQTGTGQAEAANAPASHPSAAVSQLSTSRFSLQQMEDYNFLMSHFYIVHTSTTAGPELMNGKKLLAESFVLPRFQAATTATTTAAQTTGTQAGTQAGTSPTSAQPPEILLYHTHSQEDFLDSAAAEDPSSKTIVQVGDYLTELLTAKGFSVYHDHTVYDLKDGELDRSQAYNYACDGITKILEENPSIQVVIDLHRDGVASSTHLVTSIGGRDVAQIMFFNGLSRTVDGPIPYLKNPYLKDNLAFSLQLQLKCDTYFPGFSRKIFLKSLRYNQHLRPASCLIEAGAQTNTFEEVKNAMEPLAEVLTLVLQGK